MDFDWDDANIQHILEGHRVHPEETMEVLFNKPVMINEGTVKGEMRYRVVGRTDNDRILTVVFTRRNAKFRIVTAFDSGDKDVRKYRGRKGKHA